MKKVRFTFMLALLSAGILITFGILIESFPMLLTLKINGETTHLFLL